MSRRVVGQSPNIFPLYTHTYIACLIFYSFPNLSLDFSLHTRTFTRREQPLFLGALLAFIPLSINGMTLKPQLLFWLHNIHCNCSMLMCLSLFKYDPHIYTFVCAHTLTNYPSAIFPDVPLQHYTMHATPHF